MYKHLKATLLWKMDSKKIFERTNYAVIETDFTVWKSNEQFFINNSKLMFEGFLLIEVDFQKVSKQISSL